MAKKKVFIFIGPPKTATTSLQHWFLKHNGCDYNYLGCLQPRSSFQKDDLSYKIYKILSKNEIEPLEFSSIKKQVNSILKEDMPIIISEEAFLHATNWPVKLSNLFSFFSDWDFSIVICHRVADSVVPSYFAETYGYLPKHLQKDYHTFISSDWVKQYDLNYLFTILRNIGFRDEQILLFDFKRLTSGQLTLNSILKTECTNSTWNEPIILNKENKKSSDTKAENLAVKKYDIEINRLKGKSKNFKRIYKKADFLLFGFLTKTNLLRFKQNKTIQIPPSEIITKIATRNLEFFKNLENKNKVK